MRNIKLLITFLKADGLQYLASILYAPANSRANVIDFQNQFAVVGAWVYMEIPVFGLETQYKPI